MFLDFKIHCKATIIKAVLCGINVEAETNEQNGSLAGKSAHLQRTGP